MSEKTVRPQQQPLRFSRVEPACRPIEIHVEPERVTADDRHREGWIGPIRWRTDETSAELLERLVAVYVLCQLAGVRMADFKTPVRDARRILRQYRLTGSTRFRPPPATILTPAFRTVEWEREIGVQPLKRVAHEQADRGSRGFFLSHRVNESRRGFASDLGSGIRRWRFGLFQPNSRVAARESY